jgi:riboflavin biosynthesis pyrimidine reductase
MTSVLQLYPLPARELALEGLYLGHDLRGQAAAREQPFVYSNYVTSLDGRIAIPRPDGAGLTVPSQVANPRDWRLFQELAVQADVIISSGRYLRDYAAGQAQEILQVYDDPRFTDLRQWRLDRGLPPQPDIVVVSASLKFPIPAALVEGGRRVVVFTHGQADSERVHALERNAGTVVFAGGDAVQGAAMIEALAGLGYRMIYLATGPQVHHLLLDDDVLDRLYLTLAHRLLGAERFSTVVEGALLDPPVDMTLVSAYLDPVALGGLGQLLLSYDRARGGEHLGGPTRV